MNAFVFARGGSKGVPNKNIRFFAGKPLIVWTIEFALSLDFVDNVYVSTDSNDIARIALASGAKVPFIRPIELALDDSAEWKAWRHALESIYINEESMPSEFLVLPVTSPLRNKSDIELALGNFQKGNVDVVVTMTEAHRHPSFNILRVSDDNYVELFDGTQIVKHNRQAFNSVFDMATVCYVANPNFILHSNSMFEGKVRGSLVPPERAIDIDTPLDFEIAEYIFKKQRGIL